MTLLRHILRHGHVDTSLAQHLAHVVQRGLGTSVLGADLEALLVISLGHVEPSLLESLERLLGLVC